MTIAKLVRKVILGAIASFAVVIAPAYAFTINYESKNPAITHQQLFETVDWLSSQVGFNIPTDPKVRVRVITNAEWRVNIDGYLYMHEIHLQRAVEGIRPPYAGDYWISIYASRSWGTGSKEFQLKELRGMIEGFFNDILTRTSP